MKYRIGDVAKMLGITPEAVRYYEEQKIIKPTKSDNSGYRHYSVWDIHALFQARTYRQYGYSLCETAELINTYEINDIINTLSKKADDIDNTILWNIALFKSIGQMKDIITDVIASLGKYRIEQRPAMYRLENEGDYKLNSDPYLKEITRIWIEKSPFVFSSARFSKEEYERGGREHHFGLCVEEEHADFLPEEKPSCISYIPSRLCVYTAIQSRSSMILSPQRLIPAIEYMHSQGLQLSGDVFSRAVMDRKASDTYVNYHQLWLPFETSPEK